MSARFPEPPFLRNIGLMLTYKCQVACPHCLVQAGPHRTETMSLADAADWIRQIAAYRDRHVETVALTGGEPFYDLEHVRAIAGCVAAEGLRTSVVTNAHWAESPERAIEVLRSLPGVGLLAISTDTYHQVAIPLARIRNAVQAARECGILYSISVCTESPTDAGYQATLAALAEFVPEDLVMSTLTLPAGRAASSVDQSVYQYTAQPSRSACFNGGTPIIFPDGRVVACIGPVINLRRTHPLLLGSLRQNSLAEILERAQTNAVLHALRAWGPWKLVALLQDRGQACCLPTEYIADSACDACFRLMANPQSAACLAGLAQDPVFQRIVAYARAYYLAEPEMVMSLGLAG